MLLSDFTIAIARKQIQVVDLTLTLTPEFPSITLPPEMGLSRPFRVEEISRYDARGPSWYWNNISFGEHTGTHFDAPMHWITGRVCARTAHDRLASAPENASSRRPA
jgi:kynurenine formamidase